MRVRSQCFHCKPSKALINPFPQECQRADWPNHRSLCRSLKDGTWRLVRFVSVLPGMEGMYAARINRFSTVHDIRAQAAPRRLDPNEVPPNIHGEHPFLVKISLERATQSSFSFYDRKNSFDVHFLQSENPELFDEMRREMHGPRGNYGGAKMYRWARRVSDWEFNICVDKEPQTEIKW